MKITKYLSRLAEKRTRNVLAIIVMFACTSICFGMITKLDASNATDGRNVGGNFANPNGTGPFSKNPSKCTLIVNQGAIVKGASGARIDDISDFVSMTDNKIFVEGGDFSNGNISGACSLSGNNVDVSNNIVEINAGNDTRSDVGGHTRNGTAFRNSVFGGLVVGNGNANNNKVIINDKRIKGHVFGGCVFGNGNANNNEVTIKGGRIEGGVFGGCVIGDGNANNNEVTI